MLNILIQDGKVVPYNPLAALRNRRHPFKITINGVWFGFTFDIYYVFTMLKRAKRAGVIHPYIGISMDKTKTEIKIRTDGGRFIRPLLLIHKNELLITKKDIERMTSFR